MSCEILLTIVFTLLHPGDVTGKSESLFEAMSPEEIRELFQIGLAGSTEIDPGIQMSVPALTAGNTTAATEVRFDVELRSDQLLSGLGGANTQPAFMSVETGEGVKLLDANPEQIRARGVIIESSYTKENAAHIASVWRRSFEALRSSEGVEPAVLQSIQSDVSTITNERLKEYFGEPLANRNTQRAQLDAADLFRLLWVESSLDQLDLNRRKVLPLGVAAGIQRAGQSIVSIQRMVRDVTSTGEQIRWDHLGTGFYFRGRLVTCAHLFTAWVEPRDDGLIDLSQVRVFLPDDAGRFDYAESAAIPVGDVHQDRGLWAEWDTACLTPFPRTGSKQAELWEAFTQAQTPSPFERYGYQEPLSWGVLYAVGVVEGLPGETSAQLSWIQPGPLLFPPTIGPPPSSELEVDAAMKRAFLSQFMGMVTQSRPALYPSEQPDFLRILNDARDALYAARGVMSYRKSEDGKYRLMYEPARISRLTTFSKDEGFRRNPRIHALSGDIVTKGGVSGAPVILLTSDGEHVLAGIHTGWTSAPAVLPRLPVLEEAPRAIPFKAAYYAVLEDYLKDKQGN